MGNKLTTIDLKPWFENIDIHNIDTNYKFEHDLYINVSPNNGKKFYISLTMKQKNLTVGSGNGVYTSTKKNVIVIQWTPRTCINKNITPYTYNPPIPDQLKIKPKNSIGIFVVEELRFHCELYFDDNGDMQAHYLQWKDVNIAKVYFPISFNLGYGIEVLWIKNNKKHLLFQEDNS